MVLRLDRTLPQEYYHAIECFGRCIQVEQGCLMVQRKSEKSLSAVAQR